MRALVGSHKDPQQEIDQQCGSRQHDGGGYASADRLEDGAMF
jgi:hypothetical protein